MYLQCDYYNANHRMGQQGLSNMDNSGKAQLRPSKMFLFLSHLIDFSLFVIVEEVMRSIQDSSPGPRPRLCPPGHCTLSPHDGGDSRGPSLISIPGWERTGARHPQGPRKPHDLPKVAQPVPWRTGPPVSPCVFTLSL